MTIGEALLAPHRSYLPLVRPLLESGLHQGDGAHHRRRHHRQPAAHPAARHARAIDRSRWHVPAIFQWLQQRRRRARRRHAADVQHGDRPDHRVRRRVGRRRRSRRSRAAASRAQPGSASCAQSARLSCLAREGCSIYRIDRVPIDPERSRESRPPNRRAHLGPGQQPAGAHRRDRERRARRRIAVVISNRADAAGSDAGARGGHPDAGPRSPRLSATRDDYDRALAARAARARRRRWSAWPGSCGSSARRCSRRSRTRSSTFTRRCCRRSPASTRSARRSTTASRSAAPPCTSSLRELDGGPIVLQAAVPVRDDDTVETLSARILVEEHRIYPAAVGVVLAGGWRIQQRRFVAAAAPAST